jgi:hypothetical protein
MRNLEFRTHVRQLDRVRDRFDVGMIPQTDPEQMPLPALVKAVHRAESGSWHSLDRGDAKIQDMASEKTARTQY